MIDQPAANIASEISSSQIPDRFWTIPYDQSHDPNSPDLPSLEQGANCQNFAYELLRHFGRHVPLLRSSNLWEDTLYTTAVDDGYRPLDLLLFHRRPEAFGAHVGVYLGGGKVIHLSKKVGFAAIWSLDEFAATERYRVLIGAKRPLVKITGSA